MIDRGAVVTVKRQTELLDLTRSNVYYRPRPVSERDLLLMRRIDELHLEAPYFGARKLAVQLRREGHAIGRKHVRTLMRRMGIEALYRKPRTSIPAREAAIYPYLLENRVIERPNEVWASDVTYLPMARGFLYLMAIIDLASRKVLAWRLSNTLTADFCIEALEEALKKFGPPEIFNTDQAKSSCLRVFGVVKVHRVLDHQHRSTRCGYALSRCRDMWFENLRRGRLEVVKQTIRGLSVSPAATGLINRREWRLRQQLHGLDQATIQSLVSQIDTGKLMPNPTHRLPAGIDNRLHIGVLGTRSLPHAAQ